MKSLFLSLIILFFIFNINKETSEKIETSFKINEDKISKEVYKNNSFDKSTKEYKILNLENMDGVKITELWNWLIKNGFENHPESENKLIDFYLANGGKIYAEDLIKLLNTEEFSNETYVRILAAIIEGYDGKEPLIYEEFFSIGKFSEPKNEKDRAIQDFLRNELNNPSSFNAFKLSLERAYILGNGEDLYNLINEAIEKNIEILNSDLLLGEIVKYENKLAYSIKLTDIFVKNLKEINSLPQNEQKNLKEVIYRYIDLENSIGEFVDGLFMHNQDIKGEFEIFLQKNSVVLQEPKSIEKMSNDEIVAPLLKYEHHPDVEQMLVDRLNTLDKEYRKIDSEQSSEYYKWFVAKAVVSGEIDTDEFVFEYILATDSFLEKVSLVEDIYQFCEEIGDFDNCEKYYNSEELKTQFQQKLEETGISIFLKNKIESILE